MVVRASATCIKVEQRSGKVVVQVARWPAQPDGVFFCSTPSDADLKQVIGAARRLKSVVRRRKQDHGLEKGRFTGLYRHDPIRHRDNVLALMELHIAPGEPLLILHIDICKNDPSPAEAILYRRYLMACAEAMAKELPWEVSLIGWEPRSTKEAKLIRAFGFQPRPTRGSRFSRQSIQYRDLS